MTVAPMMADGVLITGISGGEYGIRGYLEGYDPDTGVRVWRTYTIPAPGEPGSETWQDGGDAWTRGGAPTWLTGSYDPELNTVFGVPEIRRLGMRRHAREIIFMPPLSSRLIPKLAPSSGTIKPRRMTRLISTL
jgi:glucose dehydrogenase